MKNVLRYAALRWSLRRRVLDNPHFYAGTIVAMLSVNWATIVWSAIILGKGDALVDAHSRYAWVTGYVHEDLIAGAFGTLALVHNLWLWKWWPPARFGQCGYGILCTAWLFVFFQVAFRSPIQPTSTATAAVIAWLAWVAFRAQPKPSSVTNGLATET